VQFRKHSSQSKYCSTKCRGKARRERPGEKAASAVRSREWFAKNKDRAKAYHKVYAPAYYQKKRAESWPTQPWLSLVKSAQARAKKFNLAFDLDESWATARWTGRCEVSLLPFAEPAQRTGYARRNFFPSIDKIDPIGGYTKDNCRFVIWAVNSLKRDGPDEEMYIIAEAITNARKDLLRDQAERSLQISSSSGQTILKETALLDDSAAP
jgi:hypothetical protein